MIRYLVLFSWILFFSFTSAQEIPDYNNPVEMTIASVRFDGVEHLDTTVLLLKSGLYLGQKIKVPGDQIRTAIEELWSLNLFDDVQVYHQNTDSSHRIHLIIHVVEKPRFWLIKIKGLRKTQAKNLREDELGFVRENDIINENLLMRVRNAALAYYRKKGFYSTTIKTSVFIADSNKNTGIILVDIKKGPRVKVQEIVFEGNNNISAKRLRKVMPETHQISWNIFKSPKFIESDFKADKNFIINKYLSEGYRDMQIKGDTIYVINPKRVGIKLYIEEGNRYYFRHVRWSGNTRYRDSYLDSVLGIKKGDIYNQQLLESRLNMNPSGVDVASLYMDDGYLFFNVQPVEIQVENDSIDLEIRMYEGPQAIVNHVTIKGNTKTSDKVILRELHVRPGDKFSRSDVTRSIRELATLGYFDPEQLGVNPVPNPENGTVDIEFKVEEKPSDQIELSGGYGGYGGLIGVLGLTLNNFSVQKMGKKREWTPLPGGDGQRLSIRAQSNGISWQSYNFSFTEPWLGGKKPNSLTTSVYHSIQAINGFRSSNGILKTTGVVLGLAKRLKWPDDFFILNQQISYQRFNNDSFNFGGILPSGVFNDISYRFILTRNSLSDPIYPRNGSNISLSLQGTVPYSLLFKKVSENKWLEYFKLKFDAQWFHPVVGKLVIGTRFNFGLITNYNPEKDIPVFNRFAMGGNGLVGYSLDGREIISQRAMPDLYTTAINNNILATVYNRYTLEIRHPVTLNPSASIFALAYVEGGNGVIGLKKYNPFDLYKAAGFGVRVFMPMFGMLGFDIGYRFDAILGQKPAWGNNFFLGQQF